MKEKLKTLSQELKADLAALSDYIHDNPELGHVEFKACAALTQYLASHDFKVKTSLEGIETAFMATYDSGLPGPSVAFLCEYDALPEIGHGCGHNMIGAMSAGAGVLLSKVMNEVGGKVFVFGTPAEETNGAKVPLTAAGYFDDMDAVMMAHPGDKTQSSGTSLAIEPIEFKYTGKTSHAAASPEKGINALNSVIALYNGIDALRQHVTPDVRMHGVITSGGVAANVVPDEAVTQWYFRAATKEGLAVVLEKVRAIGEAAALMTGATLEMHQYELAYDDLKTNQVLSDTFDENLRQLGITDIVPKEGGMGSIDIGNVSNVAPTIHPYIAVTACPTVGHTREMAAATTTPLAHDRLMITVVALAQTGYDVLSKAIVLK